MSSIQSQSDNTDRSRHHRQDISDLLQARNPFSFLLSSSLPYMANSSQATPCHFVPHSHPPLQPMVSAPAKSRIIGVRCATTLTSNPRAPALPCTDMRKAALSLRFPLDVVSCGKPAGLYDTRHSTERVSETHGCKRKPTGQVINSCPPTSWMLCPSSSMRSRARVCVRVPWPQLLYR